MERIEIYNEEEIVTTSMEVVGRCQSIAFKNVGDVNAKIRQIPLNPLDSLLSFTNADLRAHDKTKYTVSFENPTTGVNPRVIVIRTLVANCK